MLLQKKIEVGSVKRVWERDKSDKLEEQRKKRKQKKVKDMVKLEKY